MVVMIQSKKRARYNNGNQESYCCYCFINLHYSALFIFFINDKPTKKDLSVEKGEIENTETPKIEKKK